MAKLFSSFSSSLVWRPSHSCLWTVGTEIKTFVRRESSNSASCCRVWKNKIKTTYTLNQTLGCRPSVIMLLSTGWKRFRAHRRCLFYIWRIQQPGDEKGALGTNRRICFAMMTLNMSVEKKQPNFIWNAKGRDFGFSASSICSAASTLRPDVYIPFFYEVRGRGLRCISAWKALMWNKCFLHETTRLCFFFFSFPCWLGWPCLFARIFYFHCFISVFVIFFSLPKISSSATEDTQGLLTSVWPLMGIMGSRRFGLGLGGSAVALRHVVLFFFCFVFFRELTRTFPCHRSEWCRNKSNTGPFIAAVSTDCKMSQLPSLVTMTPCLRRLPHVSLGISHALGVAPPTPLTPIPGRGQRNYHNWSPKFWLVLSRLTAHMVGTCWWLLAEQAGNMVASPQN